MQYNASELEDQQELDGPSESEMDVVTDKTPPIENQIIGYNDAQDQYILKSAGEISYIDSSELFQKVSNGERTFTQLRQILRTGQFADVPRTAPQNEAPHNARGDEARDHARQKQISRRMTARGVKRLGVGGASEEDDVEKKPRKR